MKLKKVLSLFDGMSCGQIALRELGFTFCIYYASEIDKHAIKQTQLNFPGTIQLGDVEQWKEWDIAWGEIDLILAGSPCQGFSFAGKQLAFDDPRSRLFFVFIDILKHVRKYNPSVRFLLENVNMKKQHMMVINQMTGIFPVNINSNLVSAQNRNRWYWTNIRTKSVGLFGETYADIPQPKDEGVLLKDILEKEVDEKYFISQAVVNRMLRKQYSQPSINPDKAGTLNTKNNSGQMSIDSGTTFILGDNEFIKLDVNGRPKPNQEKASCFTAGAHSGGNHSDMDLICIAMRGRNPDNPSDRAPGICLEQTVEPNLTGKTNCLTSVQKDNLILQRARGFNMGGLFVDKSPALNSSSWEQNNMVLTRNYVQWDSQGKGNKSQTERAFYDDAKHGSLVVSGHDKTGVVIGQKIRRLTPSECCRLQTVPDWYKWGCSETQQYKMLGNGWTVKVIMHILKFLDELASR